MNKTSSLKTTVNTGKPVIIMCPDGKSIIATPVNPINYSEGKFISDIIKELSNYLGNTAFIEVSSYAKGKGILLKIIPRDKP